MHGMILDRFLRRFALRLKKVRKLEPAPSSQVNTEEEDDRATCSEVHTYVDKEAVLKEKTDS